MGFIEVEEGWGQQATPIYAHNLADGEGRFVTPLCVEHRFEAPEVRKPPFCVSTRERRGYLASLAKLARTAAQVEAGVSVPITKLFALQRLISNSIRYIDFVNYLLTRLKTELEQGRSMAAVHLLPLEQKASLALHALWMLQRQPIEAPSLSPDMLDLVSHIQSLHPGWNKRIWVHASRRSLPDADLLMIEYALRFSEQRRQSPLHGYWVAQMFVTNYRNLRYYVPPESARRWWLIVEYWHKRQTYWMYGWEWYHFEPLPESVKRFSLRY